MGVKHFKCPFCSKYSPYYPHQSFGFCFNCKRRVKSPHFVNAETETNLKAQLFDDLVKDYANHLAKAIEFYKRGNELWKSMDIKGAFQVYFTLQQESGIEKRFDLPEDWQELYFQMQEEEELE